MSFVEHKVGNTLWHEIAHKMYPDKKSSFREAISNSLDEGSDKIIYSNNTISSFCAKVCLTN